MPTNLRWGCHLLAPRPAVTPSVFDAQSSNLTRRLQNTCNLSVETHNLSRPRWRPLQAARCARTHVNGQSPKDLASLMFEVWRLIFIHHSPRRQVHGLYWNDIPKALGPPTQGRLQQPLRVQTRCPFHYQCVQRGAREVAEC